MTLAPNGDQVLIATGRLEPERARRIGNPAVKCAQEEHIGAGNRSPRVTDDAAKFNNGLLRAGARGCDEGEKNQDELHAVSYALQRRALIPSRSNAHLGRTNCFASRRAESCIGLLDEVFLSIAATQLWAFANTLATME